MGDASLNGSSPQSHTISHLGSYPLVSQSVKTFKSYPVGQKSLDLTSAAYGRFVAPTLHYFQTPIAYAKPYAAKADELGDKALTRFESTVPIVKSDTKEIKDTVFAYAHWPLQKAGETKDHVFGTYNEEYKKCGGDGLFAGGKALITSGLVLTSESLSWLSSYLAARKEEAKQTVDDVTKQAKQTTHEATKQAKQTADEGTKHAQHHAHEGTKHAKHHAHEATKQVKQGAQDVSDKAHR